MVIIMGVTGSGKSYFINRIKEGAVKEGSGLCSGKVLSGPDAQRRC